ncbi:MAG TPA: TolC family outer membrane protein [Herbaspirillum sp.]|jgi:outer membrane protein
MNKKVLLPLLLGSLLPALAQATDLLSSWQAALVHDANFSAARNALTAGMENSVQGDAAVLPQVALTGNAGQVKTNYQAGRNVANTPSTSNQGQQYGMGVTLVQPIYDVTATVRRDAMNKQTRQAEIQYRIAEQDLILRVAKAYFDVLLARENVNLINAQKEAIGLQLAMAKKSFNIGSATITDTNDAQARYDAVLGTEIAAQSDLDIKSSAYRQLTELDAAQLAPISDTLLPASPQPASLRSWLAQANDTSLTVLAQQIGLDITAIDVRLYRLEGAPTISLVASYAAQIDSNGISHSGARDRTANGAIGLQLSIPLYSGGERNSQLRQAVALREQQRDTLEATRRDAEQLVRQSFLGVTSGSAQIKALEQARISGASSVASSKLGREVGVRTTVDVLNAEQNYYQTLYNLGAARDQYLLSQLQLAASVGQLNEAALSNVNGYLAHDAPP